jgi:hypothetical protein
MQTAVTAVRIVGADWWAVEGGGGRWGIERAAASHFVEYAPQSADAARLQDLNQERASIDGQLEVMR